jgi:flagellar biosynthesis protein FlgN
MHTSSDLSAQLTAELTAAEALLAKLRAEQECLVQGQVSQLEAIVSHKVRAFEHFKAAHMARMAHLQLSETPENNASAILILKNIASTQPDTAETCLALIQAFESMARINEVNGTLIKTRLNYNKQALNALLRNSQSAQFYGPDGKTRGGPQRMRITV